MLEKGIPKNNKSVKEIIEILREGNYSIYNDLYILDSSLDYKRIAGDVSKEGVWLTRVGRENPDLINYLDSKNIFIINIPVMIKTRGYKFI